MKRHRHARNLVGARDINVAYENTHTVFLSFVLCRLSLWPSADRCLDAIVG